MEYETRLDGRQGLGLWAGCAGAKIRTKCVVTLELHQCGAQQEMERSTVVEMDSSQLVEAGMREFISDSFIITHYSAVLQ